MPTTFTDQSRLGKALLAALLLFCSLINGASAHARDGAGVVVASSSPANATGSIIEFGQQVRLEPGASVTILEESGRVTLLVRSGAFRPTNAAPAARGPSLVNGVSALVGSDRHVRAQGGVRTLSHEQQCRAIIADEDIALLRQALEARCDIDATGIIEAMVERAGPPQLYVGLVRSRDAANAVIGVEVQANFESFLYCRLRRADSSILAITPDPSALPMRAIASDAYTIMFPSLTAETSGSVQCMAIGVEEDGEAPQIGDWPLELNPDRVQSGARVATSLLTLNAAR